MGGLDADKLRKVEASLEELRSVAQLAERRAKSVDSADAKRALLSARSAAELDELWVCFKAPSKGSLAERAREQGLADVVARILDRCKPDLSQHARRLNGVKAV